MGQSKDLFMLMRMLEEAFKNGKMPSISIVSGMMSAGLDERDLKEKIFEFEEGKHKTKITVFLSKDGRAVSTSMQSTYIPTPAEEVENRRQVLQLQIDEAVGAEDYLKAAELKAELNSLQKP